VAVQEFRESEASLPRMSNRYQSQIETSRLALKLSSRRPEMQTALDTSQVLPDLAEVRLQESVQLDGALGIGVLTRSSVHTAGRYSPEQSRARD